MQVNCGVGHKLHASVNSHERHSCNEYGPLIIVLICCFHRHSAEFVRPVYAHQANIASSSPVNQRTLSASFYPPNLVYHPYYLTNDRVIRTFASVPRYHFTNAALNRYSYPSAHDAQFTPRIGSNTQTVCHYAQVQLGCTFNSLCYFTPGHHKCIINVSPDCCRSNGMRNERRPPPEPKQRYQSPSYFRARPPSIRPPTSTAITGAHGPQRPQTNFRPPANHGSDYRYGRLVFSTTFRPPYVTRGRTCLPSRPSASNMVRNKPAFVALKPPISMPSSHLTGMKNNSAAGMILNGNSVAICSSQDVLDFNSSDEGDYFLPRA